MFSLVFEVADSDYGIDFCLFLKTESFKNSYPLPLNKLALKMTLGIENPEMKVFNCKKSIIWLVRK